MTKLIQSSQQIEDFFAFSFGNANVDDKREARGMVATDTKKNPSILLEHRNKVI